MKLGRLPSFKALVLLAILGAIGGTFGDALHVLTGVDGYPPAGPGETQLIPHMANWVPLIFASACVLLGATHPLLDPIFEKLFSKARHTRPGIRRPGLNTLGLFLLLALWGLSGALPLATGGPKDVVIALGALGIWALVDRTLSGLIMAVTCALGGVVAEMSLVSLGVFYYTPSYSNFLGVPSWLAWLYVAAGPTVGNLGRQLALLAKASTAAPAAPS